MTLCKRLIARLDIKGSNLIKGYQYDGLRVIGNPMKAAFRYYSQGVDEIIYLDAVASLYGRNSLSHVLRETTKNVFVPITAGGGIRSVNDARILISSGADKIAVNTAAVLTPSLLTELAKNFGSQCIVCSIQTRFSKRLGFWEVMTESGRNPSGINIIDWIQQVQLLGAGELLITSVDRDGTCNGPDLKLINTIKNHLKIPCIISGGIRSFLDVNCLLGESSISGVAIGAALHNKSATIDSLKKEVAKKGITIRRLENSQTDIDFKVLKDLKIGIVDYKMGNQQSLINALHSLGCKVILSDNKNVLKDNDLIALPGVGSFKKGISNLRNNNLFEAILEIVNSGVPIIGICLGMQMLFQESEEDGFCEGLSLLNGKVKSLPLKDINNNSLTLPHIGWNKLIDFKTKKAKFNQYFVHSFVASDCEKDSIMHTCNYGGYEFIAHVRNKNISGFQFHPERSGDFGSNLLAQEIIGLLNLN